MSMLQAFKEKALSNESQFEISNGNKVSYYTKYRMGKATCVMGGYSYYGFTLDTKLSVCAIVSGEEVYLVDAFMFYSIKEEDYPANVYSFSSKVEEVNDLIANELFPQFYNGLPIRELSEDELESVEKRVRETILQNGSIVTRPTIERVMSAEDVAKLLYGEITINDCANKYFEKNKGRLIRIKSENNELQKLVASSYKVEKWEVELANSLKELAAKTVTVEFEHEGERACEKVEKNTLLRMVKNNDYFSSYNFENGKRGDELLKKFNVGSSRWDEKGVLECKNIVNVKYGKKLVYSK